MSDTERIERLESVVRALNQQIGELRTEISALRGTSSPRAGGVAGVGRSPGEQGGAEAPASAALSAAEASQRRGMERPRSVAEGAAARPVARPAVRGIFEGLSTLGFEEAVGRYGTMALATLALLAGMGAFLTWAIAHGLLGPSQRVVLGGLGAGAVAVIGWWLRSRGTLRFGNTLLALALALLHLDLWAAGPRLHVIPPSLALVVTAVASMALAALALRTEEEALFCVGFGGALLSPFVTSTGGGRAVVLAAFGLVVIAVSIVAIRSRNWHTATLIAGVGCLLYAGATHGLLNASSPWPERATPVLLTLACAGAALVWGAHDVRARLALGFLTVGVGALAAADLAAHAMPLAVALGASGTLAALGAPRRGPLSEPWRIAACVLLPLGFLMAAVTRLEHPASPAGALVAVLWSAILGAAALRGAADRGLHTAAAYLASAAAIVLALHAHPEWCIVGLAAHGSLASILMGRRDSASLALPIAIVLAGSALSTYALLLDRAAYSYTPFITLPSLAALACTGAVAIFTRHGARLTRVDLAMLAQLPALVAFIWIRTELAEAYSYDVSVFLLIVFYALSGIAAIFHGRRRSHAPSRAVGLALACYAALKALIHAWSLSAIALRVGACLLAGAFIALVAYWYRGEESTSPESGLGWAGSRTAGPSVQGES